MSIARHTSEEQDKLDKIAKETRQFKSEEKYYWLIFLFLVGIFVLSVVAVVVHKN